VSAPRILVIENDPTDDARRLGDWLVGGGAQLWIVRPHDGDALPETLDGVAGLVVLGGEQNAYDTDGLPGAPWFPELTALLRAAVSRELPTLAVCLGGQLLAQACGGRVGRRPDGPVLGPRLVAKRDIAEKDPLFGPVPFTPDVLQWHADEISALPPGAVLLAVSPAVENQAFRVGERAWGTQFHIECDTAMIAAWAASDLGRLEALGIDPATIVARCDAVMEDVEYAWRPVAERFVALAAGRVGSMHLPVVSPAADA
jgi:GMP synthase-like glutamine amidotransferase